METNYAHIKASNIAILIVAILLLTAAQVIQAQSIYKLAKGPDVTFKLLGSSNIHDWVMTSSGIESAGEFSFDSENKLTSLQSFNFYVAAKSLKSEHESMDNRTYKTIKADQYPKISYKLISAIITIIQKSKYLIKATGELTITGVTKAIIMDVTATVNPDNTINCTGFKKIQLTDYNIKPPSFMLGAMKVKNNLTIQFNLIYKK